MSYSSTAVIIVTMICMVLYTSWSAKRKTIRKRIIMDKAKTIGRQLDCIDDIVFCHNPVYHFIKAKINAAVEAMDDEDDDRASEYFTDALLLIGPNRRVLNLMKSNLPKHIIAKIKENYEKYTSC